jgi:hypothetical protein
MSPADRLSARALARMAGALYLVNIVLGAFAVGFAPTMPGAYTAAYRPVSRYL